MSDYVPLKRKFFAFIALSALCATLSRADEKFVYPKAPTSDQVDDYFGTKVRDLYRPFEDVDAEATWKWAKIIEDQTDQWSFLVKNLGMKIPF